jgi:hypothetical protein
MEINKLDPIFKVKDTIVIEVNSDDLEKFIENKLGVSYEIVAYEEWCNYSSHKFSVKKATLSEYHQESLNSFLRKEVITYYSLNVILTHLCNINEIPEAEYIIKVYW